MLTGPVQTAVLLLGWIGALAGIAMSAAWIDAPRGLVAFSYVAVGCAAMTGLPQAASRLAFTPLLLLGLGGAFYIVGAVVYALRRPDPWPRTFGFHEIFHGLVVVAAACHFVAMLVWILPAGNPS